MMERSRSNAWSHFVKCLTWDANKVCSSDTCDGCNILYARHIRRLGALKLLPLEPNSKSVFDLCQKLRTMDSPRDDYTSKKPCYFYDITSVRLLQAKDFSKIAEEVLNECKGLCLDCVKAGGRNEGSCRILGGCAAVKTH